MNSVMLIGRILFAFMFLSSGINHLVKAEAMAGYAAYKKVPAPKLANALSGILMVLGGLSVILGVYADLGALVLAALLVIMALKMHDFWTTATYRQDHTSSVCDPALQTTLQATGSRPRPDQKHPNLSQWHSSDRETL